MAEKKNWLQRLYTAVRGQVDEPRVMTIEEVRKLYGPAVTLGAPEEIQVAQDAALCDAGVYSLIQHSFQLGQPPITEFVGYGALQAMSQNGLLRACIETVSDDMTREWIELKRDTSNPDYDDNGEVTEEEKERHREEQKEADALISEMNQTMKKYHLQDVFHLAQTLVGYEGGALIFIDTGAVGDELKTPLNLSDYTGELRMGDLKGFRVIDPVNVFPGLYNSTDPLREDYFVPETWWILGQEVHKSRLVRLVANEVPLLLKPSYNFLGIAQAQILWDYVLHFQQCRVAAADLVTKHSTTVFKTSIGDILFSGQGTQVLDTRIAYFKKNRDNLNIVAIDRETEDLVNVDAPVTGVDMICKQALEYLAAINRTPAVKLLGISPSGFNATGESDIRNYYDHILSQQEKVFRAGIQTCLDVLQLNLNGKIDKSLTFEFAKLSEEDKNTRVMYQKSKADVIGGLLDHQIISGEEARKALADDPDSGFTDLDPDEVPEDEGGGMPDMAGMMGGEEEATELSEENGAPKQASDASPDGEVKSWITTKTGAHIPIKEGETKKEAVSDFIEKKTAQNPNSRSSALKKIAQEKTRSGKVKAIEESLKSAGFRKEGAGYRNEENGLFIPEAHSFIDAAKNMNDADELEEKFASMMGKSNANNGDATFPDFARAMMYQVAYEEVTGKSPNFERGEKKKIENEQRESDIDNSIYENQRRDEQLKRERSEAVQDLRELPWEQKIDSNFDMQKAVLPSARSHSAIMTETLSPNEERSLRDYSGPRFRSLNKKLNDGSAMSASEKSVISGLDDAFKKSETTEPLVLFRGVRTSSSSDLEYGSPGAESTNGGYYSTTSDINVARQYSGGEGKGNVLEVHVPKGTPALSLVGTSLNDNESEILLPRGIKTKVVGYRQIGDVLATIVEVLPSEE